MTSKKGDLTRADASNPPTNSRTAGVESGEALTDEDRAALAVIAAEKDDRAVVRLLEAYWRERSARGPRWLAYLHLELLAGMCERLLDRPISQPNSHHPQGVDAALLAQMVAEFRVIEDNPLRLELNPLVAVQLASLVQRGLRDTGLEVNTRDTGLGFLAGVRAYFAEAKALAVLEVLRRGDAPARDVPS
jgi:hypothetical protein